MVKKRIKSFFGECLLVLLYHSLVMLNQVFLRKRSLPYETRVYVSYTAGDMIFLRDDQERGIRFENISLRDRWNLWHVVLLILYVEFLKLQRVIGAFENARAHPRFVQEQLRVCQNPTKTSS